jgi:hypothetical protein
MTKEEKRFMRDGTFVALCVAIGFTALLLYSCDETTTTVFEAPTAPDPVLNVSVLGQCDPGAPGEILCEDRSSSIPAGQIVTVRFTVIGPGGNTVRSSEVSPGGEYTASGLPPGTYGVRQVAITNDGTTWGPEEYNGIVVG